jgi:hypothetical protein
MKSFKEYLTESKKVYEFKVKIAGDCPKDCSSSIKQALTQFHVESCSAGKSTPIQEHHSEFPEHKNCSMTVFDVCTRYPATSLQVRNMVAEHVGIAESRVKVRNLKEEEEHAINHEHDEKTGKALVGTDYEASNHQELVGEKKKENFLRELTKTKHQGTEVTGTNDEILAKGIAKPGKETPAKQAKVTANVKNIFTKQVKVPTAKGVL